MPTRVVPLGRAHRTAAIGGSRVGARARRCRIRWRITAATCYARTVESRMQTAVEHMACYVI
jgi:hypothetical protein